MKEPKHNRRSTDVHEVVPVLVTDEGDPSSGVRVSQPFISRISRPGVIFGLVMTGMLAMLSMTILVVYLAPSVDRLTEEASDASDDRSSLVDTIATLQEELDTILQEQRDERLLDDCLNLFRADIEIAKGEAAVTLGDNLAIAVLTDDPTANVVLAQEIFDADTNLRDSLTAYNEYIAIDPPPGACPHPSVAEG